MNFRLEPPAPSVTIHCDGSCLDNGNSGPGGWAAILECCGKTKIIKGGAKSTTNNRMEIRAAIEGLKLLKRKCRVKIYSDSQYLVNTMTQGWRRKTNHDLWETLDQLVSQHKVEFVWVQGHSGDYRNEQANKFAQEQAKLIKGDNDEVLPESRTDDEGDG